MTDDRQPLPPARPPRTISRPEALRVMSAARASPLPAEPKLSKERLKEGAADTALNLLAVVRELWSDFRRSDRYFKYKASIVAAWALLSLTTVVAAVPGDGGRGELGATAFLVPGRAGVSVRNDGSAAWTNVTVTVNRRYRAAFERIDPNEQFTVTPALLVDDTNAPAPPDLAFTDVHVEAGEGDEWVMRGGRTP